MKNVLDNPEPLQNLADLVSAQAAFYKKAQEILEEVAPEVSREGLFPHADKAD